MKIVESADIGPVTTKIGSTESTTTSPPPIKVSINELSSPTSSNSPKNKVVTTATTTNTTSLTVNTNDLSQVNSSSSILSLPASAKRQLFASNADNSRGGKDQEFEPIKKVISLFHYYYYTEYEY